MRKILSLLILLSFSFQQTALAEPADLASLSRGLQAVSSRPMHLRSVAFDRTDAGFNLFLDKGDLREPLDEVAGKTVPRLFEYFLTGLILPKSLFWVNLRPDSPDSVIDPLLARTDAGRIMLEADLQLKKDLAMLTSPLNAMGKKYWDNLYRKAQSLGKTQSAEIPTVMRPWIVPGEIIICESPAGPYIYKATLDVRLEGDRLSGSRDYGFQDDSAARELSSFASGLARAEILPALIKLVNSSERYAGLRQVYYSLLISQWFKRHPSALPRALASRIDSCNLAGMVSSPRYSSRDYFEAYRKSFDRGEYKLQETVWGTNGSRIRMYESGGIVFANDGGNASFRALPRPDPRNTFTMHVGADMHSYSVMPPAAALNDGGSLMIGALYKDSDITERFIPFAGRKASLLAAFREFLASKGINVAIPRYIVIPTILAMSQSNHDGRLAKEMRPEIEQGLEYIGGEHNRIFGDTTNPLFVSVRPSPVRTRPGAFVSVLNIGINDGIFKKLADWLGEKQAYYVYAKLIRDLASLQTTGQTEPADTQADIDQDGREQVARAKEQYRETTGREFPQDVYEQLSIAVSAVPFIHNDSPLEPVETNAVMIQEMAWGNRKNSYSGYAISRHPVTGAAELRGTIGNKQGDEFLDSAALERTMENNDFRLLKTVLKQAEIFLKDIAEVEFTSDQGRLHLLQVREVTVPLPVQLKALVSMVKEGVITRKEAWQRIAGWDMEQFKFEEHMHLTDQEPAGKGTLLARGISAYPTGVAVSSQEAADGCIRQRIPYIVVKPAVTAYDDKLIAGAEGVVVERKFGAHVQDLALKYAVTTIAHVQLPDLIEGKTVLTLGPEGSVYLWQAPLAEVLHRKIRIRKTRLSPEVVQALAWRIESRGEIPVFVVKVPVPGPGRALRTERMSEPRYIARAAFIWGTVEVLGEKKFFPAHPGFAPALPPSKKEADPSSSSSEGTVTASMGEKGLRGTVEKVCEQKDIENFTYTFWDVFDHLELYAGWYEGYNNEKDLAVRYPSRVKYLNLDEMRGKFVLGVIERERGRFIAAVFHGVDRHKMSAYIFRSYIFRYLPRDGIESLIREILDYGTKYSYSGDTRGIDYQAGRIISHFIRSDPGLATQIVSQLPLPQFKFVLRELRTLSGTDCRTASRDTDLASVEEIHEFIRIIAAERSNKDGDTNDGGDTGKGGIDFSSMAVPAVWPARALGAISDAPARASLEGLRAQWKAIRLDMLRDEPAYGNLAELARTLKTRQDGAGELNEITDYITGMLRNEEVTAENTPVEVKEILRCLLEK